MTLLTVAILTLRIIGSFFIVLFMCSHHLTLLLGAGMGVLRAGTGVYKVHRVYDLYAAKKKGQIVNIVKMACSA